MSTALRLAQECRARELRERLEAARLEMLRERLTCAHCTYTALTHAGLIAHVRGYHDFKRSET